MLSESRQHGAFDSFMRGFGNEIVSIYCRLVRLKAMNPVR